MLSHVSGYITIHPTISLLMAILSPVEFLCCYKYYLNKHPYLCVLLCIDVVIYVGQILKSETSWSKPFEILKINTYFCTTGENISWHNLLESVVSQTPLAKDLLILPTPWRGSDVLLNDLICISLSTIYVYHIFIG